MFKATNAKSLAVLMLITLGHSVQAIDGISFIHKDWEIVCDNTGTCRAAGYQQDSETNLVSVLLTREAGDNSFVHAGVMIDKNGPKLIELSINGKKYGKIRACPQFKLF